MCCSFFYALPLKLNFSFFTYAGNNNNYYYTSKDWSDAITNKSWRGTLHYASYSVVIEYCIFARPGKSYKDRFGLKISIREFYIFYKKSLKKDLSGEDVLIKTCILALFDESAYWYTSTELTCKKMVTQQMQLLCVQISIRKCGLT